MPKISYHIPVEKIIFFHLLHRNVQQIIKPLVQGEALRNYLKRRIFAANQRLRHVRVINNIHIYSAELTPVALTRIAVQSVVDVVGLPRQYHEAVNLIKHIKQ